MRKIKILTFLLLFSNINIAQIANIIENPNYFDDTKSYVSEIDSNMVKTNILVDQTVYDSVILNINGYDAVTSISSGDWYNITRTLRLASYQPDIIMEYNKIKNIRENYYYNQNGRVRPISIIDFSYNRIKQEYLNNGVFNETDTKLSVNGADSFAFTTHRAFAASCLSYNIMGDNIKFILPEALFFTNNTEENVKTIEIDFGNGQGFQTIGFDEIINVSYAPGEDYYEVIVKITYENINTLEDNIVFSHFSFLKTENSIPAPTLQDYYPSEYDDLSNPEYSVYHGIIYTILFNPENESGKLRRPFVICDGFDPGNKRTYEETIIDEEDPPPPKNRDTRGIFERFNGDPSHWETESSANLMAYLQNLGYDVVFVDFNWGAGPIHKNANTLRHFFNDVLNNTFRDSKTEEMVLVGPSMGGLITRYTLTTMENNNENHYVKNWISFDSPHKGAYIPLGLQWLIHHFSEAFFFLEPTLSQDYLLLSFAAKQMLIYHYTNPTPEISEQNEFEPGPYDDAIDDLYSFEGLYDKLEELGYPVNPLNYNITNGGTDKLYNNAGEKIINYVRSNFMGIYGRAWGCETSTGTNKIYEGKKIVGERQKFTKTNSLAFENAPGGYHTALYSVNCKDNNNVDIDDTETKYTKATFMPTSTTFGIDVNSSTLNNTHEDYTTCNDITSGKIRTSFDKIHGMQANEEHVNVSQATRDYVVNELQEDFDNSTRPRVRLENPPSTNHKTIHQTVDGSVAYLAKENFTFGSDELENNNTFTCKEGADVNVRAGKSIVFKPGFHAKNGSKLHAKIDADMDYPDILKSTVITPEPIAKNPVNEYVSVVHDYSFVSAEDQEINFADTETDFKDNKQEVSTEFKLSLHPNPARDEIILDIEGMEKGICAKIKIYNPSGAIIYQTTTSKNGKQKFDISQLVAGTYYLKGKYKNEYITVKFVKL